MRAVAWQSERGPLALVELPLPEPGDGELLVRVVNASINPADVRIGTGNYPWGDFAYPAVLGFDFAGVVEALGPGCERFAVGAEVFGHWGRERFGDGSWAEYLTVPEDGFVAAKPANVEFEAAAAFPLAAATAAAMVEAVDPAAGEPLLVVGAGGAIGRYAVQLGARAEAKVIATAKPGTEKRLLELGAAELVDYRHEDTAAVVAELHPEGIAGLVDLPTEDKAEFARLAATVRDGGAVASACFAADGKALAERGVSAFNVITTRCEPSVFTRPAALLAAGELEIDYDRVSPLSQVPAAVAELGEGGSAKVVIDLAS